jgi:DNA-binding NtrC family response regulator
VEVIVISVLKELEAAIEAMRYGAYVYAPIPAHEGAAVQARRRLALKTNPAQHGAGSW